MPVHLFHKLNRATLLVIIFGLLAACASPTPIPTPPPTETPVASQRGVGTTFTMFNAQAPDLLNPHLSNAGRNLEPARIVLEPLATFDSDGNLVAVLAAELPSLENGGVSSGGETVTWKLRQDILWSDGQPFTADDVVFTYQFVTNPDVKAVTRSVYTVIDKIEALDQYTVKITFKSTNPAWMLPFTGTKGVILPRHMFQDFNGANAKEAHANFEPVGTGPYQVQAPGIKPQEVLLYGTNLVETNKIVFVPNEYYRDPDKPYFSRIIYRGGGLVSESARLALNGSIDFAYLGGQLTAEDLASIEASEIARLTTVFKPVVERILLNRTDPNKSTADGERSSTANPHPFLSDKLVRQAIAFAIDRAALAAVYGSPDLMVLNNLVSPPQFNSPNVFYTYDPDRARLLLSQAGWIDTNNDGIREKDGVSMKVVLQAKVGGSAQRVQKIIEANLEAVGIRVDLKITDSSILFGSAADSPDADLRFNADLLIESIGISNPDPAAYMRYWTCDQIPQKANNWDAGLNIERWCSPEYDALYEQAAVEMNPDRRRDLFIQMNDLQISDVVMIPYVIVSFSQAVLNQNIENMTLTPWDTMTWNIQDWSRAR